MHDTDRTSRFVRLLAACERQLASYVLVLVPNFADADEILQETKLRLWDQFNEYDPEKDFGAWAKTVAYYQILTYRKQKGRNKVVFSTDMVSLLADELAHRDDALSDRSSAMLLCMKRLNTKYQTLLREFYGRPSTIESVAGTVGMTVAAARKALSRSRQALYECIERRLCQEET